MKNLGHAKDLSRAISSGQLAETDVISLTEIFQGKQLLPKQYTIARFCGTPMQDLVGIHYLLNLAKK